MFINPSKSKGTEVIKPNQILLPTLLLLLVGAGSSTFADTTICLVRHAEKAEGGANPELSAAGHHRAKELARTLESMEFDACFATQYKRTQQTVEPTAKSNEQKVQIAKAGTEKRLIEKIQQEFEGKRVLIAGHSNTVPMMLRALGVKAPPKLSESDYDNLFIVTIRKQGNITYHHLHYGAPNPK